MVSEFAAGADDLAVLSAHVTACGKLGGKTVPARPDEITGEIHYSVGGLIARADSGQDVHLYTQWWEHESIHSAESLIVAAVGALPGILFYWAVARIGKSKERSVADAA